MKKAIFCFFCLIGVTVLAQDKLYLLSGNKLTVKILEIGPNKIIYSELSESGAPFVGSKETVNVSEVLLIEYKNGTVEIFNQPDKDVVSTSQGLISREIQKNSESSDNSNLLSLNTLALCISDISVFYEYLLPSRKIGIGAMAAYNFNVLANASNLYISVLNNGKKDYDLGAYLNFYFGNPQKKTRFSSGFMIKYTAISFSTNTGTSTSIVYEPTTGSQTAFLATFGFINKLSGNLIFKPFIGVGGFSLKGDYKTEINEILNSNGSGSYQSFSVLPKIYLGFNLGFSL